MDITDLQQRLTAALDRIGRGIDDLGAAAPQPDPDAPTVEELQAALDGEREVTQQLEARVRAIKERQETRVAELERQLEAAQSALDSLEADRDSLRKANDALRRSNRALREANAEGLGDAGLIDEGLQAEVEALRAAQASDRAEIDELLAALAPLVDAPQDDREVQADA